MYSDDFLLDRLYNNIGENGIKSKITMPKPVVNIQNKKTYLENYSDIKSKLERQHVPSLADFLKTELATDRSSDGTGKLVINQVFRNQSFEKVIKNYCLNYVQCSMCKSGDTEIIRENKILFMNCKNCKSKKAI